MFATRMDLEEWCSSFLEKNAAGQYVCPFDKAQLSLIKEKGYWKISGKNELWLWDVEDIKEGAIR